MLKLTISLTDTTGPSWSRNGPRWCSGSSWIEPYEHPALETVAGTDHGLNLTVGERDKTGDGLDRVRVQLRPGEVEITAGIGGIAPIYLAVSADRLHASWDLLDLAAYADVGNLVDREVARLLGTRFRYGHDTVFAGIHHLTEHSRAVVDTTGLHLTYPIAAPHSSARRLREGADPVAGYETLLRSAIDQHAYDPASACIELSGGLDSSNVAATLGAAHQGQVAASGLLIVGDAAAQQIRRRAALIKQLRLADDTAVAMRTALPFDPAGARATGHGGSPYADPYDEAKTILLERLAVSGVRTVFTGIGGDEMVAPTSAEWPHLPHGVDLAPKEWLGPRVLDNLSRVDDGIAPATVINEMTLTSNACGATAFLRAGIWPVHPLADPALIRFGEWLPLEWRRRKRLHAARLEHLGLDRDLVHADKTENFAPTMRAALRAHGVGHAEAMLRDGSPLIEAGYVDPDGLAATVRRIAAGEFGDRDTELYAVINLELALRAFRARAESADQAGVPPHEPSQRR